MTEQAPASTAGQTARPLSRPGPDGSARGGLWWRLAPVEAKLLVRRRTTLIGMLFAPMMMSFFPLIIRPGIAQAWGMLAGIATLIGMLISVYITAATVFTLRRESGALSRLRTTELTGPGIVAATGAPLFAAGVLQTLLVYGLYLALGAPFPARPLLLLAALVLGGAFCVAAGAFTSMLSRSTESIQFTATPLLLASAISANILDSGLEGPLRGALLLIPGTPLANLVSSAWVGGPDVGVAGVPGSALGLILLAIWTAIALLGAAACWRWTARG